MEVYVGNFVRVKILRVSQIDLPSRQPRIGHYIDVPRGNPVLIINNTCAQAEGSRRGSGGILLRGDARKRYFCKADAFASRGEFGKHYVVGRRGKKNNSGLYCEMQFYFPCVNNSINNEINNA